MISVSMEWVKYFSSWFYVKYVFFSLIVNVLYSASLTMSIVFTWYNCRRNVLSTRGIISEIIRVLI